MNSNEFRDLSRKIKAVAESGDGAAARALFGAAGVVHEPPDRRFIAGGADIEDYFNSAAEGTEMDIHHVWFDEDRQTGAVEFTYAPDGAEGVTHGVALIDLRDDLIVQWREYAYPGPRSFDEFLRVEGKDWKFTVTEAQDR